MKNRISLFVLCLFAGILSAQAQGGPGGNMQRRTVEERTKATMEKVTPELKLETSQIALTDSAFTGYYREMDKMRAAMPQGERPDRTTMVAAMEKLVADRDEKLKKVLTADQFKKFKDEVEPAMRPNRGGNGGPRGGGNGGPRGGK